MLRLLEDFTPHHTYHGAVVLSRLGFVGLDAAGIPVSLVDAEVYDRETSYAGHRDGEPTFVDALPLHRPVLAFSIVTDPARWRKGYGRETLRALLGHPAISHVPIVHAGIEPGNTASRRLVERAGFRLQSPNPDWEGMLTYRLARPLSFTSAVQCD